MPRASSRNSINHPDCDEIISKLTLGISCPDIAEWLESKYKGVDDPGLKISVSELKRFKSEYVNPQKQLKKDVAAVKNKANQEDEIELAVKNSSAYKEAVEQLATGELNIKNMLVNMILAIETRAAQLFDQIQENPQNTRTDRTLIEYFDKLGIAIERYHKIVFNVPDQVIQHNVTVQYMDQQVTLIQDAIKEVLAELDTETSMRVVELLNKKMSKLKAPSEPKMASYDSRLSEVKMLSSNLDSQLGEFEND